MSAVARGQCCKCCIQRYSTAVATCEKKKTRTRPTLMAESRLLICSSTALYCFSSLGSSVYL